MIDYMQPLYISGLKTFVLFSSHYAAVIGDMSLNRIFAKVLRSLSEAMKTNCKMSFNTVFNRSST